MLFNGRTLIFTFSRTKLELPSMSAYSPYLRCLWVKHTGLLTLIRQRRDHLFYGDCRSRAAQNALLPFFENSLKCVCFCLITALFDYQILCEVEEQASCMPMSPGCLEQQQRPPLTNLMTIRQGAM